MPLAWGRRQSTESENAAGQRQKEVDSYFRNAVSTWEDIYHQRSELGVMIQERQAVVLTWIRELGLSVHERILEVGCGAGLTTVALAESGHSVVAVDTVLNMLRRTLDHAAEAGVRARTTAVASDIQHLCFSNGSFGLVLAMGVIPYVYAPDEAVAELARVLRSGGHLILTAHNSWALSELLDPATVFDPGKIRPLAPVRRAVKSLLRCAGWRGSAPPQRGGWTRSHSIRTVDKWLSLAGLEKVRSRTIGFGPFTFFSHQFLPRSVGIKLHHRLQNLADRNVPGFRSAGIEHIVLARKLME
jgi:ubiquinone/menaquinone biosynthesis C-methylase UbiE